MKRFSVEQKSKAFDLYMTRSTTLTEISNQTGVTICTLKYWANREKWVAKRDALLHDSLASVETRHAETIRRARPKVMDRQLRIAEKLDDHIETTLTSNRLKGANGEEIVLDPDSVLTIARAAKASSDISSRVIGIDKRNSKGNNLFLGPVQFNLSPRKIQDTSKPAIDVRSADVTEDFPDAQVKLSSGNE